MSDEVPRLFPEGVVAAEMREPGDPAQLFPAERECVKRAVAKRAQEFAAGRMCARRALVEFGIHDFQLLAAPDRQPIWPSSMVGSITHTRGYCLAVLAAGSQLRALGVDSERVDAVGRELWPTICGPAESAWCASLPPQDESAARALLFCAKEAFYKCQFPLTEEWLDFHDLRIEPHDWGSDPAEFTVHPARDLKYSRFAAAPARGRYRFHEGLVTAGVALRRREALQ